MRSSMMFMGAVLLLSSCGDSGAGQARTAIDLCDEICGWPDECFAELGVSVQDADCIQTCEAQVDLVGIACLRAISDTVTCLGTCDPASLTDAQLLACQDVAQEIGEACD